MVNIVAGNGQIYLHFLPFLHFHLQQIVEILLPGIQRPDNSAYSILRLLMIRRRNHAIVLDKLVRNIPVSAPEVIDALQWRHNGRNGVSNHQPRDCLLNRLFRRRSKKTPKLRVTGLCVGNSPVTGEFPTLMASNAENVSIWWRHHGNLCLVNQIEFWVPSHHHRTACVWAALYLGNRLSYLEFTVHLGIIYFIKFAANFICIWQGKFWAGTQISLVVTLLYSC